MSNASLRNAASDRRESRASAGCERQDKTGQVDRPCLRFGFGECELSDAATLPRVAAFSAACLFACFEKSRSALFVTRRLRGGRRRHEPRARTSVVCVVRVFAKHARRRLHPAPAHPLQHSSSSLCGAPGGLSRERRGTDQLLSFLKTSARATSGDNGSHSV